MLRSADQDLAIQRSAAVGIETYYQHYWLQTLRSNAIYSYADVINTDLAAPTTYNHATYTGANLIWNLYGSLNAGAEFPYRWTTLQNGQKANAPRIQFSAKYSFVKLAVSGAKLVLVLGHTACGAVKGAIDDVVLGNLTGLLARIKPAIPETKFEGEKSSKNPAYVDAMAQTNVKLAIENIRLRSPVLVNLEKKGSIQITGAMYNLSNGVDGLRQLADRAARNELHIGFDWKCRLAPTCSITVALTSTGSVLTLVTGGYRHIPA